MTNGKQAIKAKHQKLENFFEDVNSTQTTNQPSNTTPAFADTDPQKFDEVEDFVNEVLKELDLIQHKEKKIDPNEEKNEKRTPSLAERFPQPRLTASADRLLGILGHCSLKGHIAHFYNLQSEIERHIKTIDELGNERFLQAYNYLKANPSAEAVFVFESKLIAANRINGRLIQKDIIVY